MNAMYISVKVEKQTALHMAAKRGDRKLVQFLLDRGARRDVLDEVGCCY